MSEIDTHPETVHLLALWLEWFARDETTKAAALIRALASERDLLRGAIRAQDERERKAGEACDVRADYYGCDWPDAVADVVQTLRRDLVAVEAERDALRHDVSVLKVALAEEGTFLRQAQRTADELRTERDEARTREGDVERALETTWAKARTLTAALDDATSWRPTTTLPAAGDLVLVWDDGAVDLGWLDHGDWLTAHGPMRPAPTHWLPLPEGPL